MSNVARCSNCERSVLYKPRLHLSSGFRIELNARRAKTEYKAGRFREGKSLIHLINEQVILLGAILQDHINRTETRCPEDQKTDEPHSRSSASHYRTPGSYSTYNPGCFLPQKSDHEGLGPHPYMRDAREFRSLPQRHRHDKFSPAQLNQHTLQPEAATTNPCLNVN